MVPSRLMCLPTSLKMVNNATLVLPAPVGAHSNRFSSVLSAVLLSRLWILFKVSYPSKAGWAYLGKLVMGTLSCEKCRKMYSVHCLFTLWTYIHFTKMHGVLVQKECTGLSITYEFWSHLILPSISYLSGPFINHVQAYMYFNRSFDWFQSIFFASFGLPQSTGCHHNYDWWQHKMIEF